jgi:NADH-quinone oxidoreductase subunit M
MLQYLLTVLILLPVLGALAIAGYGFASNRRETHSRWIALGVSLLTFLLSLFLLSGASGDVSSAAFRFEQNTAWINAIGANYHLGVDGISLWLVLLTTLIMPG